MATAKMKSEFNPSVLNFRFFSTRAATLAIRIPKPTPRAISKITFQTSPIPSPLPFSTDIMARVSMWAIGSLLPLSTSISCAVSPFRFNLLLLKMANTEAASVELRMAPSSRLWGQSHPIAK